MPRAWAHKTKTTTPKMMIESAGQARPSSSMLHGPHSFPNICAHLLCVNKRLLQTDPYIRYTEHLVHLTIYEWGVVSKSKHTENKVPFKTYDNAARKGQGKTAQVRNSSAVTLSRWGEQNAGSLPSASSTHGDRGTASGTLTIQTLHHSQWK